MAQVKNSGNDSIKVYNKIKEYSKKNKFNEAVYKLLFKSKRRSNTTTTASRKTYFIKKA